MSAMLSLGQLNLGMPRSTRPFDTTAAIISPLLIVQHDGRTQQIRAPLAAAGIGAVAETRS